MKRIVFLLLGMMAVLPAFAQPNRDKWAFKPKDSWPFLYEDFTEGVVCSDTGDDILTGRVNVSVLNQNLYYLKGEDIMEADMLKVFSVRVGLDVFVNVAGKLYKVLAESKGIFLFQIFEHEWSERFASKNDRFWIVKENIKNRIRTILGLNQTLISQIQILKQFDIYNHYYYYFSLNFEY